MGSGANAEPPRGSPSPARQAVLQAEDTNRKNGHEVLGALSLSHGFLPLRTPLLHLPAEFSPWDELAPEICKLSATLGTRKYVEAMPVLDVTALPDKYLHRAAMILGLAAVSYYNSGLEHSKGYLPPPIDVPWKVICERLGRRTQLSFWDFTLYNWQLKDDTEGGLPYNPDTMVFSDISRSTCVVNVDMENVGLNIIVIMTARSCKLVRLCCDIQDAILANDVATLKACMVELKETVLYVTNKVFAEISLIPGTPLYADPVGSIAMTEMTSDRRFAVAGNTGGGAPLSHILDAIFGRTEFEISEISRQSVELLQETFPVHWRNFLKAVGEVSLRQYVLASEDPELRGLFSQALLSYGGHGGFFQRHSLKTYGYLDTMYRTALRGKSSGGMLQPKMWLYVLRELEKSRAERLKGYPDDLATALAYIYPKEGAPEGNAVAQLVTVSVAGKGVLFKAGDRLMVFPENDRRLVTTTINSLEATGMERIQLSDTWRSALAQQNKYRSEQVPSEVPLHEFLTFARLRPVSVHMLQAVAKLAPSRQLQDLLDYHLESQLEFWDLLLFASIFNPAFDATAKAAMLTAAPDSPASLCQVLQPEVARQYSIACAPPLDGSPAKEITLLVGAWKYTTLNSTSSTVPLLAANLPRVDRRGVASTFLHQQSISREQLARNAFKELDNDNSGKLSISEVVCGLQGLGFDAAIAAELFKKADADASGAIDMEEFATHMAELWFSPGQVKGGKGEANAVLVNVISPPNFALPDNSETPVIMFAGGTGIAPFRGFWQQLAARPKHSMVVLYLSIKSESEMLLREELEELQREGKLTVRVAVSRQDITLEFDSEVGKFVARPGKRGRIGGLMGSEWDAALLYRMLLPKESGGLEGALYVCGQTGFTKAIMDSLKALIKRFHVHIPGTLDPHPEVVLSVLMAQRRLCLEVFTSHGAVDEKAAHRWIWPSELCLHNDLANGFWMMIEGRVLDVTEFRNLHPAGPVLTDSHCGIDATQPYRDIGHKDSPEVHSLLGMYEIGKFKYIILPQLPHHAGLQGVFNQEIIKKWVGQLFAVTEAENQMAAAFTVTHKEFVPGLPTPHPLSMKMVLNTFHNIENKWLPVIAGERWENLLSATFPVKVSELRSELASHSSDWVAKTSTDELVKALDLYQIAAQETATSAEKRKQLLAALFTALGKATQGGTLKPSVEELADVLKEGQRAAEKLLRSIKLAVRDAVRAFEELASASDPQKALAGYTGLPVQLASMCILVPQAVKVYADEMLACTAALGFNLE